MPLTVNVGLSRKASKNYQSTGVSINVTAELDQGLLARPRELQEQVGGLYRQAEEALEHQIIQMIEPASHPIAGEAQPCTRCHRLPTVNGQCTSAGSLLPGAGAGPVTPSQKRAITAIGRRLNIDPTEVARERFGIVVQDLSVNQASQLIEELNCLPTPDGRQLADQHR